MTLSFHISIISKERPNKVLTTKVFKYFEPIYLFVEPNEVSAYKKANPSLEIVKIPKNNMGLAYARNCVLDHFSTEPVLQLDDDIIGIRERVVGHKSMKNITNDEKEMTRMMGALDSAFYKGYKLVSISYSASNWYEPKTFKFNTRVWCIMGINSNCGLRFDEKCLSCADYDFTAQIIHSGFKSVVFYEWAFECRPMTTNAGGCQSSKLMDRKERTLRTYEYLLSKWGPRIITAKRSKKLPLEIQFHWSRIRE